MYPLTRRAASAIVATLVLAGCSSSTAQLNPMGTTRASDSTSQLARQALRLGQPERTFVIEHAVTTPSFMESGAASKPLLFISDLELDAVNIYLQAAPNTMVGQVTGLHTPYAIATDRARNLYVANAAAANVQVFAPPYTGAPALTLADTNYQPFDVAVSARGVVGVANYCASGCQAGTGNITFYAPHSTTPCATVADAAVFAYMEYGTFDKKGNFFLNGLDSTRHNVLGEITGGCSAKKITPLTFVGPNGDLGGIHINKTDKIGIVESEPPGNGPPVIYTYGQPVNHALGSPLSTTVLEGTLRSNIFDDFAFSTSGTNAYVADAQNEDINEYTYPAGGMPEGTISVGDAVSGVAVTPRLAP